jgi:SAM-dependent methyltransferase
VLDVGTGPGVLLVEIGRRRADLRLTGIDLSADMVAAARRNLRAFGERAEARTADVADLPFRTTRSTSSCPRSACTTGTTRSRRYRRSPGCCDPAAALRLRLRVRAFEKLVDAAREHGVLSGQSPRRTVIRPGVPFFPRCVRHVMTAA